MDRALVSLLLRQGGVVSRSQVREVGLDDHRLAYKLQTGEWVRVLPGVFRASVVAPSAEASLRAVSLWQPGGTISDWSAGWWWELLDEAPPRWTVVVGSPSHQSRQPGVRVRRCFLDPYDVVVHRGLRVISRPLAVLRTAIELDARRRGSGAQLIDRAKQRRLVTEADLVHAFRRARGTWGTQAMRRLLEHTGGRAHSELERIAVRLLREAGITGFTVNRAWRLSNGRSVEFDLVFPEHRLVIELDGHGFHMGVEEHQADVRRMNDILADGWTVRRFTYTDVLGDPVGFVASIAQLLARNVA